MSRTDTKALAMNIYQNLRQAGALVVCIGALGFAADASAQAMFPSWYGTLGYTDIRRQGADLGSVDARVGYDFTPNIAAEGQFGAGVSGDSATYFNTTSKIWLNEKYALYGVAKYPVMPNLYVLARLGVGETRFRVSSPANTFHQELASLNYGVGAQYNLNSLYGVRADYTRDSYNHNGGDNDNWTVSMVARY